MEHANFHIIMTNNRNKVEIISAEVIEDQGNKALVVIIKALMIEIINKALVVILIETIKEIKEVITTHNKEVIWIKEDKPILIKEDKTALAKEVREVEEVLDHNMETLEKHLTIKVIDNLTNNKEATIPIAWIEIIIIKWVQWVIKSTISNKNSAVAFNGTKTVSICKWENATVFMVLISSKKFIE
jgi:hypothetical protein